MRGTPRWVHCPTLGYGLFEEESGSYRPTFCGGMKSEGIVLKVLSLKVFAVTVEFLSYCFAERIDQDVRLIVERK